LFFKRKIGRLPYDEVLFLDLLFFKRRSDCVDLFDCFSNGFQNFIELSSMFLYDIFLVEIEKFLSVSPKTEDSHLSV